MHSEKRRMSNHISRREMYDLVWASPLAEVASKLGIDEWALRNLCDYHRVPYPRPAYWRDLAAGKKVKQTTFATTADPQLELIALDTNRAMAPEVTEALTRQRTEAKRLATSRNRKPLAETTGWEPLKVLHPILAPTARSLRSAKSDAGGAVSIGGEGLLAMSCGRDSVERALFVLDRLLRAVEKEGISCAIKDKEVVVSRRQEKLRFTFGETTVQKPYVPTVDDLKAEARRLRNNDWDFAYRWGKAYPEFVRVPTGQLFVSISDWAHWGNRRNWRDGARASLLDQLNEVVQALDASLEAQLQRRLENERNKRLWRRREENRARAEKRQKREGERVALIERIVQLRTQAEQLSGWIEWAQSIEDPDTRRMLAWANERLLENNRALDPTSFGTWLREQNLFPETDPIGPLPDDPDQPDESS